MGPVTVARFRCPRCGRRSNNANDAAEGYCGACHDWTGAEPARYGLLPHLAVPELRTLLDSIEARLLDVEARRVNTLLGDDEDLGEETATLRSLRTAVSESLLNAHGGLPTEPLRLLADLRRRLGAMSVTDARGATYTGADVFAQALNAVESFVANHLRARSAQPELPDLDAQRVRGWEPVQTVLDEIHDWRPTQDEPAPE